MKLFFCTFFQDLLLNFNDFCCSQCFFHQLIDLLAQFLLRSADHLEVRLCYRMFCNKDRTAVFERLDGCLKCIRSFWKSERFLALSKPITGRYTGSVTRLVCRSKTLQGLACHLTNALTCDKAKAFILAWQNALRYASYNDA